MVTDQENYDAFMSEMRSIRAALWTIVDVLKKEE